MKTLLFSFGERLLLMRLIPPFQDLIEDLKSELGGHFEDVVLALVRPPADYLCKQLHKAMEGMGTNEHTLIEILCSRSNSEVQEIVNAYERRECARVTQE